jgi:hypothetical protein
MRVMRINEAIGEEGKEHRTIKMFNVQCSTLLFSIRILKISNKTIQQIC